jgi:hypothetical protein
METGTFADIIPDFFSNFATDIINSTFINLPGPFGGGVSGGSRAFSGLVGVFLSLMNFLVYLILALAVVYFLWGVLKYVTTNSDDDRADAVKTITYGIIVLFVMVSLWSLVSILGRTFGLSYNGAPRTQNININNLTR